MVWQTLPKSADTFIIPPQLADYEQTRRDFTWQQAQGLTGLADGGLNLAFEAVDRHALGPRGEHTALRWLGKEGQVRDIAYRELRDLTGRFASVLARLGVTPGERVFGMAGRIPQLYVAALGTLKFGAVFCPLFSAFGPEPVAARLALGGGRVLVTTETLYRRKVAALRGRLPQLEHVLLVGEADKIAEHPGVHDLAALLEQGDPDHPAAATRPEDPALLHFTSGTTGKPKGALHVHGAALVQQLTARWVLDLGDDDIFWCTADPGWVTGTVYGILAPLLCGVTNVVDEAEFDTGRWYRLLQHQGVTVWYTAPTAIRMLMKQGLEPLQDYDLSRLRHLASVGEPLNPEAVLWGQKAFGRPFHDTWWQTETGGIMIANVPALAIKPGSMGRPLPGIEAAVVRRHEQELEFMADGKEGELALKAGWPSMFREYLNDPERTAKAFAGDWYLTGDLVLRDGDGYFHFVGRADDVIQSAGHLIGPFEVESVLLEHPAVAEAGVIGVPDPVAGETVKAFVALKPGYRWDVGLDRELMALTRKRLGPTVAPRQIQPRADLPKTRSGKILRRLLKARELGLPEGDTSTLEGGD